MIFFDTTGWDTTGTASNSVGIVRMLESFTASVGEFSRDARAAAILKRERAIESQRIAAALEPRTHAVLQVYARCHTKRRKALIALRQPPGRFAFYQGAF